jgi:hypothetical protein
MSAIAATTGPGSSMHPRTMTSRCVPSPSKMFDLLGVGGIVLEFFLEERRYVAMLV